MEGITVNKLIAQLMVYSLIGQGDRKVLIGDEKFDLKLREYKGEVYRMRETYAEGLELPEGMTAKDVSECVVLSYGGFDE